MFDRTFLHTTNIQSWFQPLLSFPGLTRSKLPVSMSLSHDITKFPTESQKLKFCAGAKSKQKSVQKICSLKFFK